MTCFQGTLMTTLDTAPFPVCCQAEGFDSANRRIGWYVVLPNDLRQNCGGEECLQQLTRE
jgi:hypothetical protein